MTYRELQAFRPQIVLVLICALFALAVTVPGQSLETFRFTAQDLLQYFQLSSKAEGLHASVLTFAFLGLFCAELFWISRLLARMDEASREPGAPARGTFTRLVICIAPPAAAAIGFLRARIDNASQDLLQALKAGSTAVYLQSDYTPSQAEKLAGLEVASQLQINWWLSLIAALLLAFTLIVSAAALLAERRVPFSGRPRHLVWRLIAALLLAAALSVLFAAYPVAIAQAITPFGVICLFFIVLTLIVAALSLVSRKWELPAGVLILLFAAVLSLLGLNDNHRIRTVLASEGESRGQPKPETIAKGFEAWFQARKDKERYQVYPVYIVATEGGGIYAAHRTATFLSDLQDRCPRFSHHLFAVSSVSGGSVGAAIFNGLTRNIKPDGRRFEPGQGCFASSQDGGRLYLSDAADEILKDDFLSPVLASFLFPDLLQKFLPFPVGSFDRARALEKAIEGSWDRHTAAFQRRFKDDWLRISNPLREPFLWHWRADGDAPALFINTTEVASGRGLVVSPFDLTTAQFSSVSPERLSVSGGGPQGSAAVPLSTAAVLSARFPWLTPAGWFSSLTPPLTGGAAVKRTVSLVDGGYFDNSGVITAQAIMSEIEDAIPKMDPQPKIKLNLIVLTSKDSSEPSSVAGDYLVPFETLLSTRAARGRIAVEQAEKLFAAQNAAGGAEVQTFNKTELQSFGYELPLGWRLSELTRLLILGQNGDAKACPDPGSAGPRQSASCVKAAVYNEMMR